MDETYVEGEDPFTWTYNRTNVLLDLIINRLPKFRNPKILKMSLWAEILEELNVHYPGNVLDVKKLKKKFDNMKKTFAKNKDFELEKALLWPHFRRMDDIMNYINDKSDDLPSTNSVIYFEVGGNSQIYMDPSIMEENIDPDKGFIWTTAATNLLLDIMEEKLSNSTVKIKSFWQVVTDTFISEYQSDELPDLDVKKVSKKFSNMKKTYLKNKKKLLECDSKIEWPYFRQVERIVENHDDSTVKDYVQEDEHGEMVIPDQLTVDYNIEVDEKPDLVDDPISNQVQETDDDWVEFEMLDEELPPEPQHVEVVDLRCRVCFETVSNFKTFGEHIQTSSGQDVKIHEAFTFATKYDLDNPESENILCFSCTNSLKFVYDFLEKAEESRNKFTATEVKDDVIAEESSVKSLDFDEIIEEEDEYDDREDEGFLTSNYGESEDLDVQTQAEPSQQTVKAPAKSTQTKKKSTKFICSKCNRAFTSETMLRRHVKIVHRLSDYPCLICHKTFTTANLLHRHTSQVHRRGRDFKCEHCHKTFQYRERLKAHERIHSEKTHLCTLCPKAYVTAKELTIHMRTHTNERPFKCEHCSESFPQKDRLTHHVKKKHLNIVYKCKYCQGFSSANHNTTRRHEMEHFKFAYECEICPKKYSKRDRFVEHLKSSHNQVMSEDDLKDMLIRNRNEAKRLEQDYHLSEAACEEGDIQMEVECPAEEEMSYIEYLVTED